MSSPSALTLPAAAPARHFPISRRGRRVPRRQHPTGPLGGRDVRPCAGARSAARSGRASIVARDGPGLTISTVMDVLATRHLGAFLLCRHLGTVLASPAGEPANRQRLSPMTSHLSLSPMTTLAGRLPLGRHRLREPGHAARHRHLVGKASRGTKSPSQTYVMCGRPRRACAQPGGRGSLSAPRA